MATRSSIVAWRIPWTEEPGGLYSPWGHGRVGHNLATKEQQLAFLEKPLFRSSAHFLIIIIIFNIEPHEVVVNLRE